MSRAPRLLPVRVRFPSESAREDSWGRLLSLSAGGAELSTPAALSRGESVLLDLELGAARVDGVLARVHDVEDDADGHRLALLRFRDELQRRALAKALTALLARSL